MIDGIGSADSILNRNGKPKMSGGTLKRREASLSGTLEDFGVENGIVIILGIMADLEVGNGNANLTKVNLRLKKNGKNARSVEEEVEIIALDVGEEYSDAIIHTRSTDGDGSVSQRIRDSLRINGINAAQCQTDLDKRDSVSLIGERSGTAILLGTSMDQEAGDGNAGQRTSNKLRKIGDRSRVAEVSNSEILEEYGERTISAGTHGE